MDAERGNRRTLAALGREALDALAATTGARHLIADGVHGATTRVQEMHRAIARRVFGALERVPATRPAAAIVDASHGAIATGVYEAIRTVNALVRVLGDAAASARPPAVAASAAEGGARGRRLRAALNAAFGDHLARTRNPLAIAMCVVPAGETVEGDRLAVFVHGLGHDETAWRRYGESYGTRLAERHGIVPLYVRYNTGLRVAENGRRLAALLEETVAARPTPVGTIALVGHSMGGLVARSACHYGRASGHRWVGRVQQVVCLGSPHLGAPLERAADAGIALLRRSAVTAPLATVADGRSAGIKDLRVGSVADDAQLGRDPGSTFVPGIRYHWVGATLARDAGSIAADLVGDLLVPLSSAAGHHQRAERAVPFRPDDGLVVTGVHHLGLLGDSVVYAQLEAWLTSGD